MTSLHIPEYEQLRVSDLPGDERDTINVAAAGSASKRFCTILPSSCLLSSSKPSRLRAFISKFLMIALILSNRFRLFSEGCAGWAALRELSRPFSSFHDLKGTKLCRGP